MQAAQVTSLEHTVSRILDESDGGAKDFSQYLAGFLTVLGWFQPDQTCQRVE